MVGLADKPSFFNGLPFCSPCLPPSPTQAGEAERRHVGKVFEVPRDSMPWSSPGGRRRDLYWVCVILWGSSQNIGSNRVI